MLSSDDALRVLVVAPRAQRIARYAEIHGVDEKRAEAMLARTEEDRSEFARRQFHVEQNDPILYDLVINCGNLDFDAATRLVLEAYRSRFGG